MSPTIMRNIPATIADALLGLNFRVQVKPALVSLYVATATEGDVVSFFVNSQAFVEDAEVNVEAATGVVSVDRDQVLFREMVPPGEYRIPATVTTDTKYILVIETR